MTKKIFITTAIDYANGVIHIGHAYEKVLADCISRYERLRRGAENVFFTTGTDEHGTTNQKASEKRGISPLEHVTDISKKDKEQIDSLDISYDRFIRTTDKDHKKTVLEFFQKSLDNGDLYKDSYTGYYCEGCEAHKTLSELNEDGQCPLHPTKKIQRLEEENYFFRWSKYADFLKELIETDTLEIRPKGKKKEMLAFVNQGLRDITVSRPSYKVSWGFETPSDPDQVIYVWFDALTNYVTSGLAKGFWDEDTEIVHFVGKDIARWHALLWPAMLKSAGYRLPDKIYVHGFMNLEGQKISKSRGNVIYPKDLVDKYGVDAVRYFLLKHGPLVEDSDISMSNFEEVYNADLANGLGNTVARLAKLAENAHLEFHMPPIDMDFLGGSWAKPFDTFRVDLVLQNIWDLLRDLDKHINENEPWKITDSVKLQKVLSYEVAELVRISRMLLPFIPSTAQKIQRQFDGEAITLVAGLFPRL